MQNIKHIFKLRQESPCNLLTLWTKKLHDLIQQDYYEDLNCLSYISRNQKFIFFLVTLIFSVYIRAHGNFLFFLSEFKISIYRLDERVLTLISLILLLLLHPFKLCYVWYFAIFCLTSAALIFFSIFIHAEEKKGNSMDILFDNILSCCGTFKIKVF